jgi:chaperone modulatory protein CbpM
MTFTETEIVARFTRLETHVLERWIAVGWLKPEPGAAGYRFDEADVARTHLICDLAFDMELPDEELALVLSLVDQLNGTRTMLRALTAAVRSQPEAVRDAILAGMRAILGDDPPAL